MNDNECTSAHFRIGVTGTLELKWVLFPALSRDRAPASYPVAQIKAFCRRVAGAAFPHDCVLQCRRAALHIARRSGSGRQARAADDGARYSLTPQAAGELRLCWTGQGLCSKPRGRPQWKRARHAAGPGVTLEWERG
ncbi:hypothetical protein SKAU_G00088690 [Synaphobranchus kaupii]|uniref:Uncharacterized protein n=1 Tax=Synaphobranchus kaupii TaxID=118154 RepID=A0A9Q1FX58_SYNKA|nr:hypothetical protein SKAU_G00088690 [Synaphobranchus kaupii]